MWDCHDWRVCRRIGLNDSGCESAAVGKYLLERATGKIVDKTHLLD